MLNNIKFRKILENKYAAILIDEYQDAFKDIMDKLLEYFVEKKSKLQICLFGDAWQTIYQLNNACGEVFSKNLKVVGKKVNFRSTKNIVNLLNKIRPQLTQIWAVDNFDGEICVVDCNDYNEPRRLDRYFKDDLPEKVLNKRLLQIENKYKFKAETLKTLMLTHKVLASHQGYQNLLDILGDSLKDLSDKLFIFIIDIVETIYESLHIKNFSLLYEIMKSKRIPINTKNEKKNWNNLYYKMTEMKDKTIYDILKVVIESKLIPTPPNIIELYNNMSNNIDVSYQNGKLLDLKNILYKEFLAAKEFFKPTSIYSTDHGVKGEEYDNIIFVISKGWANYQFEKYLILNENEINDSNIKAYERNRNLFYVGCSRARKRLCLFITYKVDVNFKNYLQNLFGKENYFSYNNFIK